MICFCVFFLGSQSVISAEKGMDVALVLDTSGSMKKNDPNQLRIQAAKLFVSLLSRNDKVSLVGFSNRAYPITPLLSLKNRKNETKILNAIEKMSAKGQYTNLHDAISSGYALLEKQKNSQRTRHIILMSDGKMDLGNQETNLRLLEKTLDDLTPKLAAANIKLHTIAFTPDSYIPLLKLAAEDTEGQFVLLKNADGIHQVFENIFERTKSPEMLPMDNDSFIVDSNVKEVTIVASKFKPNSVVTIESPDGEEISEAQHNKNVNWFKARKFDLVTIKKPARGYWLIKYSEGGNKAYIVSDITLELSTTKKHAEPGAPLHIQASLKKKNQRIRNKSILKSTSFTVKVTSPTGAEIENPLLDDGSEIGSERKDGIYGISYAFEKQGPYKVEVTAKGETFDRKKTLFVEVKSTLFQTPFIIHQEVITKPDILDSITNTEDLATNEKINNSVDNDPSHTKITNSSVDASSDEQAKKNHGKPDNSDNAHNNNQLNKESEHEAKKNTNNQHKEDGHNIDEAHSNLSSHDTEKDGELSAEELEANSHFGVKDAMIAFVGFNGFLALLGGGYYFWHKRKEQVKDKDKETTDDLTAKIEEDNNSDSVSIAADSNSEIELESEDDFSTSISDIDLENELSSILENEKNDS